MGSSKRPLALLGNKVRHVELYSDVGQVLGGHNLTVEGGDDDALPRGK